MAEYNWVDFVILGIFALSILAGLARGLMKEVLSVVVWILAYVIASHFTVPLASLFSGAKTNLSTFSLGMSFIVLFIGTLIVGGIVNYFFSTIISTVGLGFVNRLFGAVFGFIRGILIVVLVLFIIQLTPLSDDSSLQKSILTPHFKPLILKLDQWVSPHYQELKAKVVGAISSAEEMMADVLD
jgi:membrane protein required for colicin V production